MASRRPCVEARSLERDCSLFAVSENLAAENRKARKTRAAASMMPPNAKKLSCALRILFSVWGMSNIVSLWRPKASNRDMDALKDAKAAAVRARSAFSGFLHLRKVDTMVSLRGTVALQASPCQRYKLAAEARGIIDRMSALSLINGGDLDLTFIGVGSAFSKKYFQNNLLVVKGDSHLLVDCGTRAPEALSLLGLSVGQIGNYLITHTHADHIGGLEEVMLVNRYGLKRKTTMVVTDRLRKALWSMSLRGGASFNEEREGEYLAFGDFWDAIVPRRVRGGDRELCEAYVGGIQVRLFRTKHIPDSSPDWSSSFPSYGLILDGRILFTSDTRYDPEMVV